MGLASRDIGPNLLGVKLDFKGAKRGPAPTASIKLATALLLLRTAVCGSQAFQCIPKVRLAKTNNRLFPRNQDRDAWEWCREAGRAIEAAERFIHGQDHDIFSKPPKGSYERIDFDLEQKRAPTAGLPPIEIGMDAALRRTRAKPQKSRELNADGSMRRTVYRFRKGAVMRLYEDGRCCWRGEIPAICDAVIAADRAWRRRV